MALSNFLTYLLSQSLKRKGKHTKSKLILEREPGIFQTLRSSNVMTRLRSGRRTIVLTTSPYLLGSFEVRKVGAVPTANSSRPSIRYALCHSQWMIFHPRLVPLSKKSCTSRSIESRTKLLPDTSLSFVSYAAKNLIQFCEQIETSLKKSRCPT